MAAPRSRHPALHRSLSLIAGALLIAAAVLAGHVLRPQAGAVAPLQVIDAAGARAFRLQPEQGLLVALNLRSGVSEVTRVRQATLHSARQLQFDAATQQLRVLTADGWLRYDARQLRPLESPPGPSLADVRRVTHSTQNP